MTDEALCHLTRLRHLTNLRLTCLSGAVVSADVVCAYLSGPSHASLRRVYIRFRENMMNLKVIEEEIKKMLAETGKTALSVNLRLGCVYSVCLCVRVCLS